jgi:hypothetical protein
MLCATCGQQLLHDRETPPQAQRLCHAAHSACAIERNFRERLRLRRVPRGDRGALGRAATAPPLPDP